MEAEVERSDSEALADCREVLLEMDKIVDELRGVNAGLVEAMEKIAACSSIPISIARAALRAATEKGEP